jgi:hypothetical protein
VIVFRGLPRPGLSAVQVAERAMSALERFEILSPA